MGGLATLLAFAASQEKNTCDLSSLYFTGLCTGNNFLIPTLAALSAVRVRYSCCSKSLQTVHASHVERRPWHKEAHSAKANAHGHLSALRVL
eukprot:6482300-Amphidinium_carterae.1